MALEFFSRREQKYLITTEQYERLIFEMSPYMRYDKFGKDGRYTVTSLYFDNNNSDIYFETKNKLNFRQKLRLRIYDQATIMDTAFFEIKQKHNNVVNKRRTAIRLIDAYRYLQNSQEAIAMDRVSNIQVFKEIDHFRTLYNLEPEMVVSYDRHAFHCIEDPDLRVTFDLNLRCRNHDLKIENGPYGKHFIDPDLVVLEVKVTHSVPLWLTRILQTLNCKQKSPSKYCTSFELLQAIEIPGFENEEQIMIGAVM